MPPLLALPQRSLPLFPWLQSMGSHLHKALPPGLSVGWDSFTGDGGHQVQAFWGDRVSRVWAWLCHSDVGLTTGSCGWTHCHKGALGIGMACSSTSLRGLAGLAPYSQPSPPCVASARKLPSGCHTTNALPAVTTEWLALPGLW